MYTKFLSLIANFHSSFHKTTMHTLSHLTYCTPTYSGLCFASSVCCFSKFNVPFPLACIIPWIHLSTNCTVIYVQHSGFLSSNTQYWESPLFGCLALIIKYICIYPPHLEAVPSVYSLMKCRVMLPKGDNSWWFSEAALKFKRKLRNHVTFSDVACEIELNVECDSTSPGGTYSPWLWQDLLNGLHFFWVPCSLDLQVCPRVSYYLLCYVGHICGLQCYDHLGRICAVLTV